MGEHSLDSLERQPSADETLNTVEEELAKLIDLDGLAAAFRRPDKSPITVESFEKAWDLPHHPDKFKPVFYQKPGTKSGGVSVTPIRQFDKAHERLAYPVFRKCEEQQSYSASSVIRGVRAATLGGLRQNANLKTVAAAGHAYALSTAITIDQLNREYPDATHRLSAEVFPTPDVTPLALESLTRYGVVPFAMRESLDSALKAARQRVLDRKEYLLIDQQNNLAVIAGQATALLEYFAQIRAAGIDTRRHRVNLRVPVEHGTTFIGAAVVWRWLKQHELLTRGSNLVLVQAEGNDAVARELENETRLTLDPEQPSYLNLRAYPTGALRASRRIMPVVSEYADDIQVVPQEYLVRACAAVVGKGAPLIGLAESLSLGAVLMDAGDGRLDQSIPELTITKGACTNRLLLEETVAPYSEHDDKAVADAATVILESLKQLREARRRGATPPSKVAHKPGAPVAPVQSKPAAVSKETPAQAPQPSTGGISASESHRRGLQVWRGSR